MSSPEAPYRQPASSQEQAFLQALIHELPIRCVLGNPAADSVHSRKPAPLTALKFVVIVTIRANRGGLPREGMNGEL
jgi:hypothetical protein